MLLINPSTEEFGGFIARYVPASVPEAIGLLAGYLSKFGYSVGIIDEEIETMSDSLLEEKLGNLPGPRIFGISVLTSQAIRAYELAGMLKQLYPDCTVIMGGIHVTALPDEGIENGADIVVRGEGEVTLKMIYEAIHNGTDWIETPGITYKDADGKIVSTADALLINELDEIPILPYELFDHSRYNLGVITSARGCPYKCSFFSQRLMTRLTYR